MTRFSMIAVLAVAALAAGSVAAADVTGDARVIDGRTLEVGGERFRLFGIDAPGLDQTCRWPNKVIPCGQMS
ncbi:MAG: thermonuclease family protein, partial [Rhodospirillales bacterium]